MLIRRTITLMFATLSVLTGSIAVAGDAGFVDHFDVPHERFVLTGRNAYFNLEPATIYEYAGELDGKSAKMVVSVLKETAKIDGVETRVVETKKTTADSTETIRTYLAIDSLTKNIYRFGVETTGRAGSWKSGMNNARYALFMPAHPKSGQKYCSAIAAPVAVDWVEITGAVVTKKVPAGTFQNCVKLHQTSPVDPKVDKTQVFAPNVGMIVDGEFELVKYPKPKLDKNGKPIADTSQPFIPLDDARAALALVGDDPDAEDVWLTAINDPNLSDHDRQDLIEDLNEVGLDPHNLTAADLPLIQSRIDLIAELAPAAMDQVNADAFDEAYKDLTNMADKLSRR
jgi:hypothetical protein